MSNNAFDGRFGAWHAIQPFLGGFLLGKCPCGLHNVGVEGMGKTIHKLHEKGAPYVSDVDPIISSWVCAVVDFFPEIPTCVALGLKYEPSSNLKVARRYFPLWSFFFLTANNDLFEDTKAKHKNHEHQYIKREHTKSNNITTRTRLL